MMGEDDSKVSQKKISDEVIVDSDKKIRTDQINLQLKTWRINSEF